MYNTKLFCICSPWEEAESGVQITEIKDLLYQNLTLYKSKRLNKHQSEAMH